MVLNKWIIKTFNYTVELLEVFAVRVPCGIMYCTVLNKLRINDPMCEKRES